MIFSGLRNNSSKPFLIERSYLLAHVKTHSYVEFLQISKPGSMLFFECLPARKLQHAATAGAAADNTSVLHGFRMFVSSSKALFSLTSDVPARSVMPAVIAGLQCQVRLSEQAWRLLGPVKTINQLLQETKQVRSLMSVPLLLETAKVKASAKSESSSAEVPAAATAAQSRQLSPRVLTDLREQLELNLPVSPVGSAVGIARHDSKSLSAASRSRGSANLEDDLLKLFQTQGFARCC